MCGFVIDVDSSTVAMDALVTASGNTAIVTKIPIPHPGPGEIRIRVHAVALNPVDALYVVHPADPTPGRVVGSDVAGVIDKVGTGVTGWKLDDRVAGLLQGSTSSDPRPGGFAEYAILEADLSIRIPSSVSFEEAATLPLCGLTAAQALFIRLRINAPFPSPYLFPAESLSNPAILIYSAATSIGLYAVELAKLLRTPSGTPYQIIATASLKHHSNLLALGVSAVFDYRSPSWEDDILVATNGEGVAYAFDCISEDDITARISRTFRKGGGTIAVVRQTSWSTEGVRDDVKPWYGAVWMGLGKEIVYNDAAMPASPEWRSFTVAFFKWLGDSERLRIQPNPVRVMPGGLGRIVEDGFALLGSGKIVDRTQEGDIEEKPWMEPISGEKLVYRIYVA